MKKVWLAVFAFLSPISSLGKDFSGRVEIKLETNARKKGDVGYEGKLNYETKREQGTQANISLKARSNDEEAMMVQEAYIDHRLEGTERKIKIGKQEKKLGLEFEQSEKKRFTIEKNIIYKKLEVFPYVGHEMILRYEDLKDSAIGIPYAVSLGYAQSASSYGLFYFNFAHSESFNLGSWTLLQSDRIEGSNRLVGAQVFSIWSFERPHTYEVELIGGLDPFETEFERPLSGRKVYFWGLKSSYGYWFSWGRENDTRITLQTTYVNHDVEFPRYNTLQGLIGVSYFINDNFVYANEVEWIGKASRIWDGQTATFVVASRNTDDSNIKFQVKYYF
jgi:hypothetical protein